jgi:hypothetical protein
VLRPIPSRRLSLTKFGSVSWLLGSVLGPSRPLVATGVGVVVTLFGSVCEYPFVQIVLCRAPGGRVQGAEYIEVEAELTISDRVDDKGFTLPAFPASDVCCCVFWEVRGVERQELEPRAEKVGAKHNESIHSTRTMK